MNRIRELRKSRNMTQYELAEKIGITQRAIGYLEDESREPKLEYRLRLAEFFNVSVQDLFPSYKLPVKSPEKYLQDDSAV